MKRLLIIFALALAFVLATGCTTTRKATTSTAEVQISTSTESEQHNTSTTDQAVNVTQTVNDITSAVIEFTKTEYYDGTTTTDTTRHNQEATKPRDRESTEPPNAGVKSITTGRIILNGDKTETTQTNIATEQTTADNSVVKENLTTDSNTETTYEEKPKRGLIYYLGAITGALIIIAAIVFVVIAVRKYKK